MTMVNVRRWEAFVTQVFRSNSGTSSFLEYPDTASVLLTMVHTTLCSLLQNNADWPWPMSSLLDICTFLHSSAQITSVLERSVDAVFSLDPHPPGNLFCSLSSGSVFSWTTTPMCLNLVSVWSPEYRSQTRVASLYPSFSIRLSPAWHLYMAPS